MPILCSAQKTRLLPVCTWESQPVSAALFMWCRPFPPTHTAILHGQLQFQTHLDSQVHSRYQVLANKVCLCSGLMAALKICPPPRYSKSVNINVYSKIHEEVKDLKEGMSPGFPRWVLNPVTGSFVTEKQQEIKWRHRGEEWPWRKLGAMLPQKPRRCTDGQQTPEARRAWNGFSPRVSGGCKALITSLFQIYDLQNGERISIVLRYPVCGNLLTTALGN